MTGLTALACIVIFIFAYSSGYLKPKTSRETRLWFLMPTTTAMLMLVTALVTYVFAVQHALYCKTPPHRKSWHSGWLIIGILIVPATFFSFLDWLYLATNAIVGRCKGKQLLVPFSAIAYAVILLTPIILCVAPVLICCLCRKRNRATISAEFRTVCTRLKRKLLRTLPEHGDGDSQRIPLEEVDWRHDGLAFGHYQH